MLKPSFLSDEYLVSDEGYVLCVNRFCYHGEIGIHTRLKSEREQSLASSSLAGSTQH